MKNYRAAIILWTLFLLAWGGHFYTEYLDFIQDEEQHRQPFQSVEFFITFTRATLENWQSEFLQIITAAWVFKHFFWKGTPESQDS
jgi:hypothetical protein